MAFYRTTNSEYDPKWMATGSYNALKADIPKISDVLAARELIPNPKKMEIDLSKYELTRALEEEVRDRQGEPVLSAHVLPVKFPVKAKNISYPPIAKRGNDNPLWSTASLTIGKEQPMQHQLAEQYFPKNNDFSNQFTDSRPRYTGLMTRPTLSKIHSSMDTFY
jgi:hypothetical protein